MESIRALKEPFPHLIVENMYDEKELELIWEELYFLTKPNKLLTPDMFGGAHDKNGNYVTKSHAIELDFVYTNRDISNIITLNRKLFNSEYLELFSKLAPYCKAATKSNYDFTKVRYYHDGDYYDPHYDIPFNFIACTYFYHTPKKFVGGEIFFPEYDYEYSCENNSMILFPSYIDHGVKKISIDSHDYYSCKGRYCVTQFFGNSHCANEN